MHLYSNLLFIDITTVREYKHYDELPTSLKKAWDTKALHTYKNIDPKKAYHDYAGIYAEFGKIVAISVGYFIERNDQLQFRTKSYYNEIESTILFEFKNLIEYKLNKSNLILCSHNGKEFDYPFIARRFIINGIPIPKILQLSGKKPWEIKHLDTLDMWKFGDLKNYTPLHTLAAIFKIPLPNSKIKLSINHLYYEQKDLINIKKHTELGIWTLAQVYLHLIQSSELIKQIELIKAA